MIDSKCSQSSLLRPPWPADLDRVEILLQGDSEGVLLASNLRRVNSSNRRTQNSIQDISISLQ
jgi:hypothetical protein